MLVASAQSSYELLCLINSDCPQTGSPTLVLETWRLQDTKITLTFGRVMLNT